METTLNDFVHNSILVLSADTPAMVAARAMEERRVGSAIVFSDDGEPVGIVTDRDLACGVLAIDLASDTPISEVMSEDILAVSVEADLADVIEVMKNNGIRRVPILKQTDNGVHCAGIVTLDDLICDDAISLADVREIVKTQIQRRSMGRRAVEKELQREARQEQTLARLVSAVRRSTGFSPDTAEAALRIVLFSIVKRLPFTSAVHFLSQLPRLLQDELLSLPAGPDRRQTAQSLVFDMADFLGCSEDQSRIVIGAIWDAVTEFLHSNNPSHILDTLPKAYVGALQGVMDESYRARL